MCHRSRWVPARSGALPAGPVSARAGRLGGGPGGSGGLGGGVSRMAVQKIAHPSIDERKVSGEEARARTPLSSHSKWRPATDRPDPVALLEAQNLTREPDLVPVRHGRMMVSPFTFYRGAAKIM